jgi:putative Mg2+ transporter-C (MgtC) family protein
MDTLDIALRLGAAASAGIALGLNRELHGKPTGVRTLGLVGLGSALAVLSVGESSSTEVSRVIQGILTGIGFLGAGVIIRSNEDQHVHGLTTAVCAWLTACIGAACAVAQWRIIGLSIPVVFFILIFGGSFEKAIHRRWRHRGTNDSG